MKKSKKSWARLMAVLSLIVLCLVGVAAHQVASANDAEVNTLKVKTQLKTNSDDASKKDIRLLTAIDDYRKYQYVGFEIKVTGTDINKDWNKTEKKAWTSILENGQAVSPSTIFGNGANYFVAHSVTGIPKSAWNATWVVRPYGVTLAGDTVYGTERQFSIQSTIDNLAEGSLSGKITLPVASTEAPVVTLTNSANTTTYTTTVADGGYVLNVPQDTYKMTVKHSGFADNYVEAVKVEATTEQNVSMRKNINYSVSSKITDEGYCYIKSSENARFANGCGTAWKTELEIPEIPNWTGIGFSLIANNGSDAIWGQWMRIYLVNAGGTLQVDSYLNIDGEFNIGEVTNKTEILASDAVGQILQLVLDDGTLTLKLGETELAVYDSSYSITQNNVTGMIKNVFGDAETNGIDCGLSSFSSDFTITDWYFTNIYNPDVKHTVSGAIGAPVNEVNLEQVVVQLTSEDGTTYSKKSIPDASGNYKFTDVPEGKYKITVTHSSYADNTKNISVIYNDVVQNILLRKNKNYSLNSTITDEGYCYIPSGENARFVNGCGTAWKAEFEMPEVPLWTGIGFSLIANNGSDAIWGQWMRIYLVNFNGVLQVESYLNIDGEFNVGEITNKTGISVADAEGQMLQLVLDNGTLTLKLGETVLAVYDSSYSITQNNVTSKIEDVLVDAETNGIDCGLSSFSSDFTIKDWAFMQMNTISGTVTSPISDTVSDVTLTFENAFETHVTSPNEDRTYSVQVLCGTYQMIASHSEFADNTAKVNASTGDVDFDIKLRKNINYSVSSKITDEGYCYIPSGENARFMNGCGTGWKAEFEIPEIPNWTGIGFSLIANNGSDAIWGQWMRIYLVNVNGVLQVDSYLNIDGELSVAEVTKETGISVADAKGQMLQLVLNNGTLTLKLGETELAVYDSNYSITNDNVTGTIDSVLGISGTNGIDCGLSSFSSDFTIKDWVFEKNFF